MSRTTIVPQTLLGPYPALPISSGGADPSLTAASGGVVSYQAALTSGKTLVLCYNSDSSAHTVTVTSAPDATNRKGDITAYSVAAKAISILGPFATLGWAQTGNLLYVDIDSDLLQIAVINEF
jgi:hypothetical protein